MRGGEFDDPAFLARLRAGEQGAYRALIRRFHGSLVSVANSVIGSRAQAEEVVQDSWLAVFNGISRFEGRSSLATWVFAIVLNRARSRASREARTVALPGILDGAQGNERAVELAAFQPDGHWVETPRLWDELDPERVVAGRQLWAHVQAAIERLPAGQRAVIVLRDTEGREAEETCALLGISTENQRVLLHRARGRIRKTIDALVAGSAPAAAARAGRARRHTAGAQAAAARSGRRGGPAGRLGGGLARPLAGPLGVSLAGPLVGCPGWPLAGRVVSRHPTAFGRPVAAKRGEGSGRQATPSQASAARDGMPLGQVLAGLGKPGRSRSVGGRPRWQAGSDGWRWPRGLAWPWRRFPVRTGRGTARWRMAAGQSTDHPAMGPPSVCQPPAGRLLRIFVRTDSSRSSRSFTA